MTIRVTDPGALTTVQDVGRWGSQHLGVSVAGPMDGVSHRLANLLVGNPVGAATLEVTILGPTLQFVHDTTFAVAGATFALWLNESPVRMDAASQATAGSWLRFGRRTTGARAYVAVAGGIEVPPVLGSRSTDLAGQLGGLGGRPLRVGDRIEVGRRSGVSPAPSLVTSPLAMPRGGATVRFLSGPHLDRFEPDALDRLTGARFTLAPESNRMGYRLEGPDIRAAPRPPLVSTATPLGTIQVPPSGRPMLLMVDRQTTGGYPQIGTVISADLPLAGQLSPGDWIAFERCERRDAVAALVGLEHTMMGVS